MALKWAHKCVYVGDKRFVVCYGRVGINMVMEKVCANLISYTTG